MLKALILRVLCQSHFDTKRFSNDIASNRFDVLQIENVELFEIVSINDISYSILLSLCQVFSFFNQLFMI